MCTNCTKGSYMCNNRVFIYIGSALWHSCCCQSVRNMAIDYPNYLSTFTLIFYPIIKNIFIIYGQWDMSRNDTSAIYLLFRNCLREACHQLESFAEFQLTFLFRKCFVWNTCSATTISGPRLRPSGGQTYISMSPLNSWEFHQRLGNTQEVSTNCRKVLLMTRITSLAFPIIL